MKRNTKYLCCVGLLACIFLSACAGTTTVLLQNYSPTFSTDISDYKGKRIYLMNFDNQAWDTTAFMYYGQDKKVVYKGNGGKSLIHNYFWYAFEKGFVNAGILVSNKSEPDPAAPGMWVTLKSITDARYEVDVRMRHGQNLIFLKTYAVMGDPISGKEQQLIANNLEKRAYQMTDKLIQTILMDPEFKNAFFKAAAEMSASQSRK